MNTKRKQSWARKRENRRYRSDYRWPCPPVPARQPLLYPVLISTQIQVHQDSQPVITGTATGEDL